ncbi:hypothetical protein, partial [Streptomyces sp. 8N706]|uniref:hypothetical protein n=1 Tax=Streptomyces sp. 8N706 TaxID=3457416 RepID=UPI003FD01E56
MAINGDETVETVPGTALLIAAAPVGKGRLMDTTAVLPALAAVPPRVLTGTAGASVVELVDPADPQVVLTRLRTAAAFPGPLLIHLIGQLTLDRKQHLPHLALARTSATTVRYTGFPWHWLTAELQHRPAGSTAMLADLVTDAGAWAHLRARPGALSLGGVDLYGTVAPPPERRAVASPAYSRAVSEILRPATARPPLVDLHRRALAMAGLPHGEHLLLGAGLETAAFPVPGAADSFPAPGSTGAFPLPDPGPTGNSAPGGVRTSTVPGDGGNGAVSAPGPSSMGTAPAPGAGLTGNSAPTTDRTSTVSGPGSSGPAPGLGSSGVSPAPVPGAETTG